MRKARDMYAAADALAHTAPNYRANRAFWERRIVRYYALFAHWVGADTAKRVFDAARNAHRTATCAECAFERAGCALGHCAVRA